MDKKIVFREFEERDTEIIADIIRDTWHYNDLCSLKTAGKLAKVYLNSCLVNQTYTQVALAGDIPIGIIMGKNIRTHKCPKKYRINQVISILRLLLSGEGQKVVKIFSGVSDIDKQLLEKADRSYQGELAFFAVSASARGKGVGKELFNLLTDSMKEQGIDNFYLFTDTSCNFGFYEHQGMNRRCKMKRSFEVNGQNINMEFYLYDYVIREME